MRTNRMGWAALACAAGCSAAWIFGCSAAGDNKSTFGSGSGGWNAGGQSAGGQTGTGSLILSNGGSSNGGSMGTADGSCAEVVQQAEKRSGGRADIIFALDNSGSMQEEAIALQNNMNAFSQQITATGIDAHVIVISSGPPGGVGATCQLLDFICWANLFSAWGNANGICIDPPLGLAGACPAGNDSNPPNYLHLFQEVDSHNALGQLQAQFPSYQSMLRPDAAKTFVVVTDDEATPPDANAFKTWVDSQPIFQSATWRLSGIFCLTGSSNCANVGTTYIQLADMTGGIKGDMSQFASGQVDAQFKSVFDSVANAIVADARPVDCEWGIPVPTDGTQIDFNTVNVHYLPGGDATQEKSIYWVANASSCTTDYYGWYYDDPAHPTRVKACPDVCQVMQADTSAVVQVLFNCAREEPPLN